MNQGCLARFILNRLIYKNNVTCPLTIAVRSYASFKGASTTGKKRFRQPVKDDAQYLVSHVSGSNIFKSGEDIKIKDDSEYPDWIWTVRLDGYDSLEDLDPNSKEYWKLLEKLSQIRVRRLQGHQLKPTMRVGPREKKKLMLLERFKFRVLPPDDIDMGFDPNEVMTKADKKLWLRPQIEKLQEEEVYPDLYTKEHPEKFVKPSRPWDYSVGIKTKDKSRKRKWY